MDKEDLNSENHTFESSMVLPLWLYFLMGFRFDWPENIKGVKEFFRYYGHIIAVTFTWFLPEVLYCEALWPYEEYKKGEMTFNKFTFSLPCILYGYQAAFKIIILFSKRFELINIYKQIGEMYKSIDLEENRKEINDKLGRLYRMMRPICILSYINLFLFGITPLIQMAVKYLMTGKFEKILPFLMAFPFDYYNSYIFPIIYIRELWDGAVAMWATVGPDSFLVCAMTHLALNLELIARDLRSCVLKSSRTKVNEDSWAVESVNVDPNILEASLRRIIMKHSEVLRLVSVVAKTHSLSSFTTYFFSAINICLNLFNVMFLSRLQLAQFVTFLSVCVIQIFICCYIGNIISDAAKEVSVAVYDAHWYLCDKRNRKSFAILLAQTQEPFILKASPFISLNLETFSKVMSSSASYFTLLKTFYALEEDKTT